MPPFRFIVFPGVLASSLFWAASAGAQKPAELVLFTEPLTLRPGEPLSIRTLVQRPPAIPGAISWTIETRRHRGFVNTSALSPDGKWIATGGLDGIIRMWDTTSGQFVRALVGHGASIFGLAWSPDGKTLASAGSYDTSAKLWDTTTWMNVRTLKGHKGYTHHVAWSRDGRSLVVAGGTSGFVSLWDVAAPVVAKPEPLKKEPTKTVETGNPITGLAWGLDDKTLAVSGNAIGVQVFDLREGKGVLALAVPGMNGTAVAWSPNGKSIVGGSATKTRVWDATTGMMTHELSGAAASLAFTKDGSELAVSTGTAVWVCDSQFKPGTKPVAQGEARHLAWLPDGKGLFGHNAVAVLGIEAGGTGPMREIDVAGDFPVELTPGRPLITNTTSASPQLWDVATGKHIATLEGHAGAVAATAWSRDGKWLATGGTDKTVRVWGPNGKAARLLVGHEGPIHSLAWADGKTLASGSADKTVRVWPAASDKAKVFKHHKETVTALAWSKDGKQVLSGDEKSTMLLWSPDNEKTPVSMTARGPVQSLAISGTAKALAVGGTLGEVEIFNPTGGQPIHTYERPGSPPAVTSLAWAPDGITLLAGRGNYTSQVWRLNSNAVVFDLPGMSPITHVAWTVSGNGMVTSEAARNVRVFDLGTGQLRGTVIPDGKQVAVVSTTGHYRVADEVACELVYVVQTPKGQETIKPSDFATRFRFANKATSVGIIDK